MPMPSRGQTFESGRSCATETVSRLVLEEEERKKITLGAHQQPPRAFGPWALQYSKTL